MSQRQNSQPANLRAALIGASALVVVALVLGADLSARSAVVRIGTEAQRESLVDRPAVRQLTTTLARAMRELTDPPAQDPAISAHLSWDLGLIAPVGAIRALPAADRPGAVAMLLPELLDLPPPANV